MMSFQYGEGLGRFDGLTRKPCSVRPPKSGLQRHLGRRDRRRPDDSGTLDCLPCVPGTFGESEGGTTCAEYPEGQVSSAGAESCDSCPDGAECVGGSQSL